jgi:hypothetical protein
MRPNTAALCALPNFALIDAPNGDKWAILKGSPLDLQNICKAHACTPNETSWGDSGPGWLGLDTQSLPSFRQSNIAEYPLRLVKEATAKLPQKLTKLADQRAAVTGGFWDVPAVIANIPMAARTRIRNKLAPKQFKIGFSMSCNIDAAQMAALTSRIARALWDYTIAGGVATLTIYHAGFVRRSETGAKGLITESHINCADQAALSLALSPTFLRTVAGPLMTAFSDSSQDSIPVVRDFPLPGVSMIGGIGAASLEAAERIIKELSIV